MHLTLEQKKEKFEADLKALCALQNEADPLSFTPTQEQLKRTLASPAGRNLAQHSEVFHPFTCGRDRFDDEHLEHAKSAGYFQPGILEATEGFGWICPACGWRMTGHKHHFTK